MLPSQAFNHSASSYEAHTPIQKLCAFHLARMIRKTDPSLSFFSDLGCGTGYLTEALMAFYPNARYHLIDFAPKMIEECQKKFLSRCTYEVNDFTQTSVAGFCVSNFAFQWLFDMPKFPALAFSTLVEGTWAPWQAAAQKLNIKTHSFLSVQEWTCRLESYYPFVHWFTQTHMIRYPSVFEFLRSLKAMGGHGSHHSPHYIRPLLRCFQGEMVVPFHVLYAIGSQK